MPFRRRLGRCRYPRCVEAVPGNVVLVGFSGTGKSRVGQELAERLGWPFVDTDQRIVARFGCTISTVFREHGEQAFRQAEAEEVVSACALERRVIALGGGAIVRDASLAAARDRNLIVGLTAAPETIWHRLTQSPATEERPLLSGPDPRGRIERLLAERASRYAEADVTVVTDRREPSDIVDEILVLLRQPWPRR